MICCWGGKNQLNASFRLFCGWSRGKKPSRHQPHTEITAEDAGALSQTPGESLTASSLQHGPTPGSQEHRQTAGNAGRSRGACDRSTTLGGGRRYPAPTTKIPKNPKIPKSQITLKSHITPNIKSHITPNIKSHIYVEAHLF